MMNILARKFMRSILGDTCRDGGGTNVPMYATTNTRSLLQQ